jgi:hypothetical protein
MVTRQQLYRCTMAPLQNNYTCILYKNTIKTAFPPRNMDDITGSDPSWPVQLTIASPK